jgi:hypothetical protein
VWYVFKYFVVDPLGEVASVLIDRIRFALRSALVTKTLRFALSTL